MEFDCAVGAFVLKIPAVFCKPDDEKILHVMSLPFYSQKWTKWKLDKKKTKFNFAEC